MKPNKPMLSVLLAVFLMIGLASCGLLSGESEQEIAPSESPAISVEDDLEESEPYSMEEENRNAGANENEAGQSAFEPVPQGQEPDNAAISNTETDVTQKGSTATEEDDSMTRVNIGIGEQVFAAQFYNNETAQAFVSTMPLTLDMSDLNRNEKMVYLPESLPTGDTERPETIHAGEIMLYYDDCVVLFYETFSSSYGGYTRLGFIEDVTGLADALGSGDVTVSFSAA